MSSHKTFKQKNKFKERKRYLENKPASIPEDILKIQKKLATFEKGSRNYKKYSKILSKHIKKHSMLRRLSSHINTIEKMDQIKDINTEK